MSLEAMTKIRAVENGVEQAQAQARAQGQKLIADAQREGREALERSRQEATGDARGDMARAEEAAAKRREEILAQAAEDCRALKAQAAARMDQAVRRIVERVVEE